MSESADLVVVGGGPAGYGAALRAARRGVSVTLVEREEVGGVCLNRGCIPTKAMLHVAGVAEAAADAGALDGAAVDFGTLVRERDAVVSRLRDGVAGLLSVAGVEVVRGTARLDAKGVVVDESGSERQIAGRHVLLATGSQPFTPDLPGLDLDGVLDSDSALAANHFPDRVVVAGGGAIGCEWASILTALGHEVILVEAADHLLPGEDPALGKGLRRALTGRGVDVRVATPLAGAAPLESGVAISAGGDRVDCGCLLLALGRRAVTEGLGLEARGVELDERGFVRVDQRAETTATGISAAGDVTGEPLLAHAAVHQANVVVDRLAGIDATVDLTLVPSVTYTHPEAASVGLTPAAAEQLGRDAQVVRFPFAALGRAVTEGATEGFVQLVADREYGQLLGAQILGERAGDLIAETALAIALEATLDDLAAVIHPHPTLSEGIVEAALVGLDLAAHMPTSAGGPA